MHAVRLPHPARTALTGAALVAFLAVGLLGTYRYVDGYWLFRGFGPPTEPTWVAARGTAVRFYLPSPALGGRRQPVDVYLPPGYAAHPRRRYPVLYLLHGLPAGPAPSSRPYGSASSRTSSSRSAGRNRSSS